MDGKSQQVVPDVATVPNVAAVPEDFPDPLRRSTKDSWFPRKDEWSPHRDKQFLLLPFTPPSVFHKQGSARTLGLL